tara:strand:+ start:249 stop:473 length:225 start_codon:yes stop_codon:yes gene_type:complete
VVKHPYLDIITADYSWILLKGPVSLEVLSGLSVLLLIRYVIDIAHLVEHFTLKVKGKDRHLAYLFYDIEKRIYL